MRFAQDAQGQGLPPLAFLLRKWRRWRFTERAIDRAYAAWARADRPDAGVWRARVEGLRGAPLISVVMPVRDPPEAWLRQAVASVQAQFYGDWQLVIADDGSVAPHVAAVLDGLARDQRIEVVRLGRSVGVSLASNAALARATGAYVTFLDHDDVLAPQALAAVACELAASPDLDMVFSDEDQLVEGRRAAPYFKPGFNPDLMLSHNAVCHMAVYRRSLVARLGGLRAAYDGSQDFDLCLRVMGEVPARRIRHVPMVLYHWRQSAGSLSGRGMAACRDAAARAVADHLRDAAAVGVSAALPQWPEVRFLVPAPRPSVSVIGAVVAGCESVAAAAAATGDVLLFLAPGLRPVAADWREAMLGQVCRAEIGAVGARLCGPDGRLLHAGYGLDPVRVAVSAEADAADPGYRGQFMLARSVAAVSLDCLMVRREVFVAAGGLDARAGDFAGVDFCARLAARGLRCVWEPRAWLAYDAPPKPLRAGADWMRGRWGDALARDPYTNPNLVVRHGRLGLARAA